MSASTFIGIDVGGASKGFHAVLLRDGAIVERTQNCDAEALVRWCSDREPRAIGVDAPCRWSANGRARPAERELARERIFAFATPSAEAAQRPFYRWMLNGALLYQELERHFPLFQSACGTSVCFETFPQAVACALAGRVVSARQKRLHRRGVLAAAGIDTAALPNIDYVDAALCAVAACYVGAGTFKTYGDAASGFIIVPRVAALR